MESENIIPRVPSGVPGLDEMICGGFEQDSSVLVVGGPGCGKSTLCMQYLYNGVVQHQEKGVYITFEEQPKKMKRHMATFGWDIEKLEQEGKIRIVRIMPQDVFNLRKEQYGIIVSTIQEIGAKRIVVDSVTSIEAMIENDFERKNTVLNMIEWFQSNNCTTLITSEVESSLNAYKKQGDIDFLVDAVLVLYNIQKGNVRESALEILKMRGTPHMKKIVPFRIGNGLEVYPKEEVMDEMELIIK